MDALKSAGRALLRSPSVHKPSWAGGRHKKLPENWTDTRETLLEGMLFSLKYMGMTLVEQPKGEELSAAAVKRIVATAKASGKKLQKVTLKVSPRGIVLNDSGTNELIENVSIYRISYCTADKIHDKVFAYIAQNQLNENLECHAFLCTKRKMAQAVTLTVAQAFKIAFELWQAAKEEKEKRERSILEGEGTSSPSSEAPAHPDTPAATGNLLDLEDPAKSPLTGSANSPHLDNSIFGPSSSVNNNVVWEMDDGLDEAFSRCCWLRPFVLHCWTPSCHIPLGLLVTQCLGCSSAEAGASEKPSCRNPTAGRFSLLLKNVRGGCLNPRLIPRRASPRMKRQIFELTFWPWENRCCAVRFSQRLAQSRTNPHVLDTGLTAQDIQSAETLSPVDWNKIDSAAGEKDDLFMF